MWSTPAAASICSVEWVESPIRASSADDPPRLFDGHVILADVDAVGPAVNRQVGVVVDEERHSVGVSQAPESLGGPVDDAAVAGLLPQLDHVHAAVERGPHQRLGVFAVRTRVADEVQPRHAQPLPPERADSVCRAVSHV